MPYRRGSTGPCTGPGSPESCYSDWASLSPTPFGSHATYTSQSAESTGFTPAFTPNPTAPGTASRASCDQYISYLDTGDESLDKTINTCGGIAKLYGTTAEKLKEWNPSLRSSQPCLLKTGLSYCVVVKDGMCNSSCYLVGCCTDSRNSVSGLASSLKIAEKQT